MRRLINRVKARPEIVGIPVLALIVIAGLILGFKVRTRLGPLTTLNQANPEAVLKISEHFGTSSRLPNNLSDTTQPNYGNTAVIDLPRDPAGNVPSLFRIQGEIIFR